MNRTIIAICLLSLMSTSASAQSETPLRGPAIELFDGQTLNGWETRDGRPSNNWVVEDGAIFRSKRGGDLYHKLWLRDFELAFEWRLNQKGNSGIKYRVQNYGKQMLGCEYQIQDDGNQFFTKQSTGAIYGLFQPSRNKAPSITGAWNKSRIYVCGNTIRHWLNGELIVDATVGDLQWLQRVEQSKFADRPFFGQNREGRLFLQDHGQPVWYRNIVLVPLNGDKSSPVKVIACDRSTESPMP